MQAMYLLFLLIFIFPDHTSEIYQQEPVKYKGIASYYGSKFHGRKTASGELFDMKEFTAAHKTLPFNTLVKVTNLTNQKSVIVRVNDRGPFSPKRIIDISKAAAEEIDMIQSGFAEVEIEILIAQPDTTISMFEKDTSIISPIEP